MELKVLYPASHHLQELDQVALALKISRHHQCLACSEQGLMPCHGLKPPPGFRVLLDTESRLEVQFAELTEYGFEPEENEPTYLIFCGCGHDAMQHGADMNLLGHDEFIRRARVAIRCDELLQDLDRLLDFDYLDNDIQSLRMQMQIPAADSPPRSPLSDLLGSMIPSSPAERQQVSRASSFLSDTAPFEPPSKRRRVSFSSGSSLSESDSDSSGDEEKPLAAEKRSNRPRKTNGKGKKSRPGQRTGGKGMPGKKKSKSHTAPTSILPPTEEERADMEPPAVNGINGHEVKVKVEDKMDEGQLTRLATGVTVDAGNNATTNGQNKPEKPSHIELRKGIIKIVPVENDGEPRSFVILTGLKTLFQKQLPKMPREYIARLVYDSNSKCLAIIKRGYKVVGGICFRPFPHRGFAEIVFFATASVDQVKGYGGMLMDHFKSHIKDTYPAMMHFLTYADNYAVGYFRKQGFSKEISLDRSVWAGYIKDYEGGTIMQCTMLDKVDYLKTKEIIAQQREAILEKIREKSKSHIVYAGLNMWRGHGIPLDPRDIPGLRESGWTPSMAALTARPSQRNPDHTIMTKLLSELQQNPLAWPFLQPVPTDEVTDYLEYIKKPMDFSTMEHKLETNQYSGLDSFLVDAQLVFDNCRAYNAEGTTYHKSANKLEKALKDKLAELKSKQSD